VDSEFQSTVVVIPFEGRRVRHLAGVFYDSTRAETTFCGQPTKAMSREPAKTVFDHQRDCQNCAGTAKTFLQDAVTVSGDM